MVEVTATQEVDLIAQEVIVPLLIQAVGAVGLVVQTEEAVLALPSDMVQVMAREDLAQVSIM